MMLHAALIGRVCKCACTQSVRRFMIAGVAQAGELCRDPHSSDPSSNVCAFAKAFALKVVAT